jgi:hypothetical protein
MGIYNVYMRHIFSFVLGADNIYLQNTFSLVGACAKKSSTTGKEEREKWKSTLLSVGVAVFDVSVMW